eukprot:jgi/Mesvir1/5316/Mv15409-RA.2
MAEDMKKGRHREYSLRGPEEFDLGNGGQNGPKPASDSWESFRKDSIEFPSDLQDISTLTAVGDSRPDIALTPPQDNSHPRLYTSSSLPQRPTAGWLHAALETGEEYSLSDPDRHDDFALDTLSDGGPTRPATRRLFASQAVPKKEPQGRAPARTQSHRRKAIPADDAPASTKAADPEPKRRRPKRRSIARARETAERLNEWWTRKKAEREELGRQLQMEEAAELLRERAAIMAVTQRNRGGQRQQRRSTPEDTVARLLAWGEYRAEKLREKAAEWEAQERVKPPRPQGGNEGGYQVIRRYPTGGPNGADAMDFLVQKLLAWGEEKKEEKAQLAAALREKEEREREAANPRRPVINPVSQAMHRGPELWLHWEEQRQQHIAAMREEVAARELRAVKPGPSIDPVSAEMAAAMPRPKRVEDRLLQSGEERRQQIAAMARVAERERAAMARGVAWRQQQKQKQSQGQKQQHPQQQPRMPQKQSGTGGVRGTKRVDGPRADHPDQKGGGASRRHSQSDDDNDGSDGGDEVVARRGRGEGAEGRGDAEEAEGRYTEGSSEDSDSSQSYSDDEEPGLHPEDEPRSDSDGGSPLADLKKSGHNANNHHKNKNAGHHHHPKPVAMLDGQAVARDPPAALRSSRGSNDPVDGAVPAHRDGADGPVLTVPDDAVARLFGCAGVYEGRRRVRAMARAVAETRDKETGAPLFRPAINPVSRTMKRGVPIEDRLLQHGVRRQQKLELLARRNEVVASIARAPTHRYPSQGTTSSSSAALTLGSLPRGVTRRPASAAPARGGGQHAAPHV